MNRRIAKKILNPNNMETIGEMCGDNRFELIAKAKEELIAKTNIETSQEEMAVIDSILFRMWQMKWLPGQQSCKYANESIKQRALEKYPVREVEIPDIDEGCPSWLTEYENAVVRAAYIKGVTEQQEIDDAENGKALLHAVDKTTKRVKKEMIEKVCEWLRLYLPVVIDNYSFNGRVVAMRNEDMRDEFRKAMEE